MQFKGFPTDLDLFILDEVDELGLTDEQVEATIRFADAIVKDVFNEEQVKAFRTIVKMLNEVGTELTKLEVE